MVLDTLLLWTQCNVYMLWPLINFPGSYGIYGIYTVTLVYDTIITVACCANNMKGYDSACRCRQFTYLLFGNYIFIKSLTPSYCYHEKRKSHFVGWFACLLNGNRFLLRCMRGIGAHYNSYINYVIFCDTFFSQMLCTHIYSAIYHFMGSYVYKSITLKSNEWNDIPSPQILCVKVVLKA